jgi:hypothetical protein
VALIEMFPFQPFVRPSVMLNGRISAASFKSRDFDRHSLRGAVIQTTAPYCTSFVGVSSPASLATVILLG